MPSQLKRWHSYGHRHFVTFSCYERRPFLSDHPSKVVFLEELERLRRRHQFFVFAHVLMPEHVHLLVSEPRQIMLADVFRALKTQTSKKLKGDRKQFWQRRYYDFNIFTHAKFVEKIQYIHRNPVTRGLVANPQDYPWSTFCHWATGHEVHVEIESHWTWTKRERAGLPNPWHQTVSPTPADRVPL